MIYILAYMIEVRRRIDMFKCKHKRQEEKNCYYEDYHCVEYDIYCKDCKKYLINNCLNNMIKIQY